MAQPQAVAGSSAAEQRGQPSARPQGYSRAQAQAAAAAHTPHTRDATRSAALPRDYAGHVALHHMQASHGSVQRHMTLDT